MLIVMKQVVVHVSNYLRITPGALPDSVVNVLHAALTVSDPDSPNDPATVLWGEDAAGMLCIPRGFAIKLRRGLERFGYEPIWVDERSKVPVQLDIAITHMTPRHYQAKAIERMVSCEQGIYVAPPGAGKTIAAAFFIARIQQRTLVIVDKINIATQWYKRIEEATGYKCGVIGDDQWFERDITIVTRQTLWRKRDQLRASGFFDAWGAIIVDECHAISAPTVRAVMNDFSAHYRIGLSATPDRHAWMVNISRSVIGEIFCVTTDRELEEAGVLVRPEIVAVRTDFTWPWDKRKSPRTQWAQMLKDLKFDGRRNNLFGRIIAQQRGHSCLVHTDHKGHAHELAAYCLAVGWPQDAVIMLTGDQSDEERTRAIERASQGDCVILSTIGQEAMDIPRLSRFFLVFPTKNDTAVRQMIGRLKRTHETKTEVPIAFDFYDYMMPILANHFNSRRGSYDRDQLKVTIKRPDELGI